MSFGTRYGFGTVVLASNGSAPIVEALLPRDGSRPMVGDLDLARLPTQDQHATSKEYVDDLVATFFPDAPRDGVIYARQDALWVPAAAPDVADDRVLRAGDTMTGDLVIRKSQPLIILDDNQFIGQQLTLGIEFRRFNLRLWDFFYDIQSNQFRLARFHPVTGDFLDFPFSVSSIDGRVILNPLAAALTLPGDPVDALHAATKGYVDRLFSGQPALIGVIDAATGECGFTPASGFPSPGELPPANETEIGAYLICVNEGTIPTGPGFGTYLMVGDWIVSDQSTWTPLRIGHVANIARNVALVPPVDGADNVQDGIENIYTEFRQEFQRYVTLDTDQTIGVRKTFTVAPRSVEPTADADLATKWYVDQVVRQAIHRWTAGLSYAVGEAVVWDGILFTVVTAITNAPAIPDFNTIRVAESPQGDFWSGVPGQWIANNWFHLATFPAYGQYRFQADCFATQQDTSFILDITTSYNHASLTIASYSTNSLTTAGMWGQFRLSAQGGNANPIRLEAQSRTQPTSPQFKFFAWGLARQNNSNQLNLVKPPFGQAQDLGGTQYALVSPGYVKDRDNGGFGVNGGQLHVRRVNTAQTWQGQHLLLHHCTPIGDPAPTAGEAGITLHNANTAANGGERTARIVLNRTADTQIDLLAGSTNATVDLFARRFTTNAGDPLTADQLARKAYVDGVRTTPLVVQRAVESFIWNQQAVQAKHCEPNNAMTNVVGQAGIAWYNFNTPANGDLRKVSIILNRVAVGGTNQLRLIDGDALTLRRFAASNYDTSIDDPRSLIAKYDDDNDGEVDLKKVIESLLLKVADLERGPSGFEWVFGRKKKSNEGGFIHINGNWPKLLLVALVLALIIGEALVIRRDEARIQKIEHEQRTQRDPDAIISR
jgi:hypothetical protein